MPNFYPPSLHDIEKISNRIDEIENDIKQAFIRVSNEMLLLRLASENHTRLIVELKAKLEIVKPK
jgi:hypothetical protein